MGPAPCPCLASGLLCLVSVQNYMRNITCAARQPMCAGCHGCSAPACDALVPDPAFPELLLPRLAGKAALRRLNTMPSLIVQPPTPAIRFQALLLTPAGQLTGTGQYQVPHACQPPHGQGMGPQRHCNLGDLSQAARDQSCPRIVAEAEPICYAACDGQDVLQSPSQLNACTAQCLFSMYCLAMPCVVASGGHKA